MVSVVVVRRRLCVYTSGPTNCLLGKASLPPISGVERDDRSELEFIATGDRTLSLTSGCPGTKPLPCGLLLGIESSSAAVVLGPSYVSLSISYIVRCHPRQQLDISSGSAYGFVGDKTMRWSRGAGCVVGHGGGPKRREADWQQRSRSILRAELIVQCHPRQRLDISSGSAYGFVGDKAMRWSRGAGCIVGHGGEPERR